MKKVWIIFLPVMIIAAAAGYFLARNAPTILKEDDAEKAATAGEYVVLSAKYEMTYRYTMCGHEIAEAGDIASIVGLTKNELSQKLDGFVIQSFSADRIKVQKTLNCYCPKHYLLKIEGGELALLQNKEKTDQYVCIWKKNTVGIKDSDKKILTAGKVFSNREEAEKFAREVAY